MCIYRLYVDIDMCSVDVVYHVYIYNIYVYHTYCIQYTVYDLYIYVLYMNIMIYVTMYIAIIRLNSRYIHVYPFLEIHGEQSLKRQSTSFERGQ